MHSVRVAGATWVINEDDSSIQIVESDGGAGKDSTEMHHRWQECKVAGDKATASFWYNGRC